MAEKKCDFILLIDDLEHARVDKAQAVYDRYRSLLDAMLRPKELQARASVHFLVNMLEAYYFGDARAINAVLKTELADYEGDVEQIRHPKNDLKRIASDLQPPLSFDEVEHGRRIIKALDIAHVLSNPETCRSLRTAYAWCYRAMGLAKSDRFRLSDGRLLPITQVQLDHL